MDKDWKWLPGVFAAIFDDRGRLLCVRHNYGRGIWSLPGGGIEETETVVDALKREVLEETGLRIEPDGLIGSYSRPEPGRQTVLIRCKVIGGSLIESNDEIAEVKYFAQNQLRKSSAPRAEPGRGTRSQESWDLSGSSIQYPVNTNDKRVSRMTFIADWLGRSVDLVIDRPLGSRHPDFAEAKPYPINYGEVPGTVAEDDDPIDAYLLGVTEAVTRAKGIVIAVIRRLDDPEIKLVVAPEGASFSDEDIARQVNFQERYFQSEVISKIRTVTYTSAGGVVLNGEDDVLVLEDVRNGDVRLPKGHVEHGETASGAALREVAEETGHDDLEVIGDLGEQEVTFEFEHQREGWLHVARNERYFLMRLLSDRSVGQSGSDAGRFRIEWLKLGKAPSSMTYAAEQEWTRRAASFVVAKATQS